MARNEAYPWIDRFRLLAALMVVAIHTAPLASLHAQADAYVTLVLCRVAVPFFFMVSGFFLFRGGFANMENVKRFLLRTAGMYGISMLLYLPINLYAGQLSFPAVIGDVLIDGTMYHLWYFPALMLGVLVVTWLLRRLRVRGTLIVAAVLYVIGLLGDSYYGLTEGIPFLNAAYEALFTVFDYTRNGLFFAPLFLSLGAWFAQRQGTFSRGMAAGGLIGSLLLMCAEGFIVHRLDWVRHDSMYVFLVPCMFFLFALLLGWRGGRVAWARDVAMLTYVLHPLVIVVVRGAARVLGAQTWLIDNSLIHFAAVAVLSFAGSAVLWVIWRKMKKKKPVVSGRPTRIEVDLEALQHNVRVLEADMPQGCRLMAVVKAQAYGHGAIRAAQALWGAGVRYFAVATMEEGLELRRAGLGGVILILGYTAPGCARTLWRYRLTQAVISPEHGAALDAAGYPVRVHIKIDTGMHRVGTDAGDREAIAKLFGCRHLKITGVFTHFCIADSLADEAVAFTETQIARFEALREMIDKCGISDMIIHAQSSSGYLNYPYLNYGVVRAGIALYGLTAEAGAQTRLHPDLRPTLALRSEIVLLRRIAAGESVGYGCTYVAPSERLIAVVPIGYADGVPRELAVNGGRVLVRGISAPIVGRICMDQMMVDVTEVAGVALGDTVTLIGRDGDEIISAGEVAQRCGTITNELLSRLGERPQRIYFERKE